MLYSIVQVYSMCTVQFVYSHNTHGKFMLLLFGQVLVLWFLKLYFTVTVNKKCTHILSHRKKKLRLLISLDITFLYKKLLVRPQQDWQTTFLPVFILCIGIFTFKVYKENRFSCNVNRSYLINVHICILFANISC